MDNKPIVIVEIEGGVCVGIHTNMPVDHYILDWDNVDDGDSHDIPEEALAACGLDPKL